VVATQQLRAGADVIGSQGERLGTVELVRTDGVSGQPTSFVIKSGFWIFGKHKMLSTDTVAEITDDRIVVGMTKHEFRGIPELDL